MIDNAPGIERLRRAFTTYEGPEVPNAESEEIDTERIYRAAAGELTEDERRAVIDQVAMSSAAAEVWRLAVELQRAEGKAVQEMNEAAFATGEIEATYEIGEVGQVGEVVPFRRAVPPPPRRVRYRALTAIAALLAVTIGFGLWSRMHAPAPELRGAGSSLSATIADGAHLPREAFRLTWKPLPEAGTRYTVRVTTEDLRLVVEARHLETASYQVPADRLAAFPAGARLLWQVEAKSADGRTVSSPAYAVEIDR